MKLTCEIRLTLSLPFFTQQRTLCFPSPSAFNTLRILKPSFCEAAQPFSAAVPALPPDISTSESSAPLESTPASFVTFHIISLYVALCGRISASISTCLLSGPSLRLPFTIRRTFRTGISSSMSVLSLSAVSNTFPAPESHEAFPAFPHTPEQSSMQEIPDTSSSAATAFSVTTLVSIPTELTSTLISPGSVLAPITARSFPENILLLLVLYCSKSALSPLSIPRSLPAPVTFIFTLLLALSTGLPSLSTALMSI